MVARRHVELIGPPNHERTDALQFKRHGDVTVPGLFARPARDAAEAYHELRVRLEDFRWEGVRLRAPGRAYVQDPASRLRLAVADRGGRVSPYRHAAGSRRAPRAPRLRVWQTWAEGRLMRYGRLRHGDELAVDRSLLPSVLTTLVLSTFGVIVWRAIGLWGFLNGAIDVFVWQGVWFDRLQKSPKGGSVVSGDVDERLVSVVHDVRELFEHRGWITRPR